ncbi:MAG: amino acid ABC transporter ATP-binding protein [Clostridia bacterium]|nr:amino acid ABC transporter ATP-binding protein [Clostridia bacterium]
MLQVSNVFKSFGETGVLKGVSVRVSRGEVVAIIGRSGSGKSTLLRCMNNLETIDSGEILIGGDALVTTGGDGKPQYKRDKALRTLMLKMGMVFQDYNLFPHYSVLKNLVMPQTLVLGRSQKEAEKKAMELLGKVGLCEKANEYPCNLSGGQCQRVAIARALCMDPDILCFDEPTSALDPQLTHEVLSVIRQLADEKRTMIVVTHEMNFARDVADRVIYMEDGLVVEDGPAKKVLGTNRSAAIKAFAGEANY